PGFGPPPRFPERRRGPWTTVAVTLVAVAAAATMAVFVPGLLRSDAQSDTGHDARTPSTGGVAGGTATPVASGTPDVSPSTPAASVNLLTPNGARTAVAALRGVTGGSKVITMTVYPQYVIAEAPAQTDPAHLYDNFQYRD